MGFPGSTFLQSMHMFYVSFLYFWLLGWAASYDLGTPSIIILNLFCRKTKTNQRKKDYFSPSARGQISILVRYFNLFTVKHFIIAASKFGNFKTLTFWLSLMFAISHFSAL